MRFFLSIFLTINCVFGIELHFAEQKHLSTIPQQKNATLSWIRVELQTNTNEKKTFSIMSRPVSQEDFYGFGDGLKSVTDITYEMANKYCLQKYQALVSDPYIFEAARDKQGFVFSKNARYEVLSPVDYEEELDMMFYRKKDNLAIGENLHLIRYNIKKQTYHPYSLTKRLKHTTFRCMRY